MNQQNVRVAEIEISYSTKINPSLRPKITSAKDAFDLLLSTWDHSRIEMIEQFSILLLNRGSRVLGIQEISTGGVSGTVVDPKIIFASALKALASSIILAHNHPSGNLQPSQSDIEITKKLVAGGKILEVCVVDHIILSKEGYTSFANEGLI
jgi:DNA repair protein RadC